MDPHAIVGRSQVASPNQVRASQLGQSDRYVWICDEHECQAVGHGSSWGDSRLAAGTAG